MPDTIHTEYPHGEIAHNANEGPQPNSDARGATIAGLVGAVVGAAGYLIYQRLPDEQRARLQHQVRTLIDQKVSELRENFRI